MGLTARFHTAQQNELCYSARIIIIIFFHFYSVLKDNEFNCRGNSYRSGREWDYCKNKYIRSDLKVLLKFPKYSLVFLTLSSVNYI